MKTYPDGSPKMTGCQVALMAILFAVVAYLVLLLIGDGTGQ